MMKLVVDGIIDQSIPWSLVLVGVAITIVVHFLKLPTLAFAVGVYLPLATMFPVFVGGLIRRIVEKKSAGDKALLSKAPGGWNPFRLRAGRRRGLMGVGIAAYAFFAGRRARFCPTFSHGSSTIPSIY